MTRVCVCLLHRVLDCMPCIQHAVSAVCASPTPSCHDIHTHTHTHTRICTHTHTDAKAYQSCAAHDRGRQPECCSFHLSRFSSPAWGEKTQEQGLIIPRPPRPLHWCAHPVPKLRVQKTRGHAQGAQRDRLGGRHLGATRGPFRLTYTSARAPARQESVTLRSSAPSGVYSTGGAECRRGNDDLPDAAAEARMRLLVHVDGELAHCLQIVLQPCALIFCSPARAVSSY